MKVRLNTVRIVTRVSDPSTGKWRTSSMDYKTTSQEVGTVYDATKDGPVVVMMGENAVHHIGKTCFLFRRQKAGMTLDRSAEGWRVMFIDGRFRHIQGMRLLVDWNRTCTVVEAWQPERED
tara:strand:- start:10 stop:372 length:363 start_codon:yes stop_codon:yes gene_type:complete